MVEVKKRGGYNPSGKSHTREERNCGTIIANEPLKVLLKDTLSRKTMFGENSIQTGLCGDSLMITIEQFNPGFTNSSNQIAIKKDIRTVRIGNNLSVIKLPIFAIGDSFVHQAFDLSHWLNSFDSLRIHDPRGSGAWGVPLVQPSHTPGI